jgi:pilus assembly protein CpaE
MIMTDEKLSIERSERSKLRLGVLCINMDPSSRGSLEGLVAQTPGAYVVDNLDSYVTVHEIRRILEPYQYRICVIDFDHGVEESARLADRLRDCDGLTLFAAASNSDPDHIITSMRSGCSEYLLKPLQADRVSDALAHVESRRHIKTEGTQKGRIISLMGAKGGTGVTSLALHLALNLAQKQKKCMLVDEHPAFGDVSLYLGLQRHLYSFYELVHSNDRLDADLLRGFVLEHSSGLHVLDSPESIGAVPQASEDAIEHTLAFLADNYEFVIVDCPPRLGDETCAAVRQSDQVGIVITPELPAIRNAVRAIEYLTGLHYPEDRIDIVLNRHSKRSALREEEIEAALHRKITAKIPNEYNQIVRAINEGTPIESDHRSNLTAAFDSWASGLLRNETLPTPAVGRSRGWLDIFGSRKEEAHG